MKKSAILIRKQRPEDIQEIVELWYSVSLMAHSFISPDFWKKNKKEMANKYLPGAQTLVAIEKNKIVGFVSVVDKFLSALFDRSAFQGKGIGSHLLSEVKKHNHCLKLSVFVKNDPSVKFYLRQGFRITDTIIDYQTGEKEFIMEWILIDNRNPKN